MSDPTSKTTKLISAERWVEAFLDHHAKPAKTMPTETTKTEIEAGANALAIRHFLDGGQWPLSRFPENMQDAFREKARAVLDAAAECRKS